jgi:hypothetical protein
MVEFKGIYVMSMEKSQWVGVGQSQGAKKQNNCDLKVLDAQFMS